MKRLLLLLFPIIAISCSNELNEMQRTNSAVQTHVTMEPRFVTANISTQQAKNLAGKFLNRTSFFHFEEAIGWDPTVYVYHGAFTVNHGSETIKFRAIDCGISAKDGKYGVYAESPVSRYQFSNIEYPDIHGEILYEENTKGLKTPIGVRYHYESNCKNGNTNCWIILEWESAGAYERIIGY